MKILTKYSMFVCHFQKIENNTLEDLEYPNFLEPIRFSYEKFNERDKIKFRDDLLYF
jgi:hypothetical protein